MIFFGKIGLDVNKKAFFKVLMYVRKKESLFFYGGPGGGSLSKKSDAKE